MKTPELFKESTATTNKGYQGILHYFHCFSINRINNTKIIPYEDDKEMDSPGTTEQK